MRAWHKPLAKTCSSLACSTSCPLPRAPAQAPTASPTATPRSFTLLGTGRNAPSFPKSGSKGQSHSSKVTSQGWLIFLTPCSQGWGSITPGRHSAVLVLPLAAVWPCLPRAAPLCPRLIPHPLLLLPCPSPSFLLCIFGNSVPKRHTGNSPLTELPPQTFPSCSH